MHAVVADAHARLDELMAEIEAAKMHSFAAQQATRDVEATLARERRERRDTEAQAAADFEKLENAFMRARVQLQDVTEERDQLKLKAVEDAGTIAAMLGDLKRAEESSAQRTVYVQERLVIANMRVENLSKSSRDQVAALQGKLQIAEVKRREAEVLAAEAKRRAEELQEICDGLLGELDRRVEDNERAWTEYMAGRALPDDVCGGEDHTDTNNDI